MNIKKVKREYNTQNAIVEVIPNAGPNIHVDALQEVTDQIKKWLERLAG